MKKGDRMSVKRITIVTPKIYKRKKTCGNCLHTDNELGIVALHCDLVHSEINKVRSWETCMFKFDRWEKRVKK